MDIRVTRDLKRTPISTICAGIHNSRRSWICFGGTSRSIRKRSDGGDDSACHWLPSSLSVSEPPRKAGQDQVIGKSAGAAGARLQIADAPFLVPQQGYRAAQRERVFAPTDRQSWFDVDRK